MNTNLESRQKLARAVLFSAMITIPASALAADTPRLTTVYQTPDKRIAKTWEFVLAPYLVAANITGTAKVGRLPSTDVDVGTSDILENLRFGFMGRAEAIYQQKFGAMIDLAYMNLATATDTPISGGRVRVEGSQLILETMLFYRAHQTQKTSIDLYAGTRYWDVDLGVDASSTIAGNFNISRNENWLDPVLGIRAMHRLNDKWSLNGRGDIGGFGIGSDFSWNVQGGVGYHFNTTWSAHMQYKALSVDYNNGNSGISSFSYDTLTHGPLLGIVAKF